MPSKREADPRKRRLTPDEKSNTDYGAVRFDEGNGGSILSDFRQALQFGVRSTGFLMTARAFLKE